MNDLPEKCCRNCHFFCKHTNGKSHPVEERYRTRMLKSVDNGIAFLYQSDPPPGLHCAKRVWSDYDKANKIDREEVPNTISMDRDEGCFFHPYAVNVSTESAQELECRARDRREMDETRRIARNANRIAIAAIVFTILFGIVSTIVAFMKP